MLSIVKNIFKTIYENKIQNMKKINQNSKINIIEFKQIFHRKINYFIFNIHFIYTDF